MGALRQLQGLLDSDTFWAGGRSPALLRRMLRGSEVAVSAWRGTSLVGFGRATSDGTFRAVLWDVVVAKPHVGTGIGRSLVESLLDSPAVRGVERVYLMTSQGQGFYERLGFSPMASQKLMLKERSG